MTAIDEHPVSLTVHEAGWLSTFQDLGREDSEALGVPCGGAADQLSAATANILAGNGRKAALLEIMGGRFSFTPERDVLCAVTGVPADITVNGDPVPMWEPLCLPAGARVVIANAKGGMRNYLAFSGHLDTPRFMGSAAPEARMGFPQQITAGQRILLRTRYRGFTHPYLDQPLFRLPVPVPDFNPAVWTIDVVDGPETGRTPGIRKLLESSHYTVGPRSNHVGLRLDGPVVHPEGLGEIVSHGVPIGAFEIPHGDELIILGRSRTLTAGYPIVAIAAKASLPMLGQASPGRKMTFRWVGNEQAVEAYREQQRGLALLEERVRAVFGAVGLPHAALPAPAA
ncbi:biotin-dependent carboxyltransferase family protein [Arthrobacter celericrescens]|uniref:5-oxoprolinase subunit C family protein n=1 Tax=Arthrobacter celericrescens TaxID=2320851 RepID=UPI001FDFFE4B|nr:biotin-dependent carboxyltransferase family protein [Arthrobacter celericrescens]